MESDSIFIKLKSKYIYQIIFEFIINKNFKYNLFKYSKFYQNKFGIDKYYYEEKYIKRLDINFTEYFNYFELDDKTPIDKDKDILKKKLEKDIIKFNLDFDLFKKYILIYSNYKNENEEEDGNEYIKEKYIDIYSPFFDDLSKTDFFDKIFCVPIIINAIEKYYLKNDYILAFEKLNKLNLKYPTLKFIYQDGKDIKYFEKLKLNINSIKKLIIEEEKNVSIPTHYLNLTIFNKLKCWESSYDYFFKRLFSYNGIAQNLVELSLSRDISNNKLSNIPNLFENINKLKELQKLTIIGYKFEKIFTLKLYNLKELHLFKVENIKFDDNFPFKLKILSIFQGYIIDQKKKIDIPDLELCSIGGSDFHYYDFTNFINFENLYNLKELEININDYFFIKNIPSLSSLEKISIKGIISYLDDEIFMIKKIISMRNLKKVEITLRHMSNYELLAIKEKNNSIIDMTLNWNSDIEDCIIYSLQNLFPNLINLTICARPYTNRTKLIIKENKNCKINKLYLCIYGNRNIAFYCQNYENLREINFNIKNKITKMDQSFPIFKNKSNVIFKSLNHLKLNMDQKVYYTILENLYSNIDNMPNLKTFSLDCHCEGVTKEFYKDFIIKLLGLKLDKITLKMKSDSNENNKYLKEELIELCPNAKNLNYKNINIEKF